MEIDIRKNIVNNLKGESTESLIETIDTATNSNDELVLPGLGVLLELVWHQLQPNDRKNFANLAIKKMNG